MSLDAPKICELCGENVNTYGHAPTCAEHYCRECDERHSVETPHVFGEVPHDGE